MLLSRRSSTASVAARSLRWLMIVLSSLSHLRRLLYLIEWHKYVKNAARLLWLDADAPYKVWQDFTLVDEWSHSAKTLLTFNIHLKHSWIPSLHPASVAAHRSLSFTPTLRSQDFIGRSVKTQCAQVVRTFTVDVTNSMTGLRCWFNLCTPSVTLRILLNLVEDR